MCLGCETHKKKSDGSRRWFLVFEKSVAAVALSVSESCGLRFGMAKTMTAALRLKTE